MTILHLQQYQLRQGKSPLQFLGKEQLTQVQIERRHYQIVKLAKSFDASSNTDSAHRLHTGIQNLLQNPGQHSCPF
jgi:hypothetical protein